MLDLFMAQRFMLAWRAWLTDRLTGDWLDGKAYYRGRFIDDTIDNPDQRIQYDIDIFTAGVGGLPNTPNNTSTATLLFGCGRRHRLDDFVHRDSVEPVGHAHAADRDVDLPKGDVRDRASPTCCSRRSSRSGSAGRSSGCPSGNEKFNAAFRYALVRLRDASEAVAFYRGEIAERTGLRKLFAPVVANYKRYINRMMRLLRLEPLDGPDHRRRCRTCCSSRGSSPARSPSAP